jgi:Protein of unknown function (DUF3551)
MTKSSLALLAFVFLTALAASGRPAAAIEYPWCAEYSGEDGGGGRNCGFATLAQCMATVSGVGGGCVHNLFYDEAPDRPAPSVRKHRNRSD